MLRAGRPAPKLEIVDMMVALHQLAALFYLAASLAALLGLAADLRRARAATLVLLVVAALVHGTAFARLHTLDPAPALTELPMALSLVGWLAALFAALLLGGRARLLGLAALVAPLAFLSVVFAGEHLSAPGRPAAAHPAAGYWAHVHVILAAAGLALLGVAALAGMLFLAEERRLKTKRPVRWGLRLPSLETLDRVNRTTLALGFPLLTLALLSGMLWSRARWGTLWPGGVHVTAMAVAWALYAVLAVGRFAAGWRGREAAASAALGFALLIVAVLGAGWWA